MFGIVKDCFTAFSHDIDGNSIPKKKRYALFIIHPLIVCGLYGCYIFLCTEKVSNISDILMGALGLFSALVFCVLFIIPDKFFQRYDKYKDKKEEAFKNYLIRFKNFSKLAIKQMILFLFCIILLTACLIIYEVTDCIIILFINIYLFTIVVSLTLITLQNVYVLLKDEIK